jgi:hypothetical protein
VSSRARLSALLLLAPSVSSSSSSPALDAGGDGAGISLLLLMTTMSRCDGDSVWFFCDGEFTRVFACCFSRLGAVARAPSSESMDISENEKKKINKIRVRARCGKHKNVFKHCYTDLMVTGVTVVTSSQEGYQYDEEMNSIKEE